MSAPRFLGGTWIDFAGDVLARASGDQMIVERVRPDGSRESIWTVKCQEPPMFHRVAQAPDGTVAVFAKGNVTGAALLITAAAESVVIGTTNGNNPGAIYWDGTQFVAIWTEFVGVLAKLTCGNGEHTTQPIPAPWTGAATGILDLNPDGSVIYADQGRTYNQAPWSFTKPNVRAGVRVGQWGLQGKQHPELDRIIVGLPGGQDVFTGLLATADDPRVSVQPNGRILVGAFTGNGATFAFFDPPYPPAEQPPAVPIVIDGPAPVPVPRPVPIPEPTPMPQPSSPFSWSSLQIIGEAPDVRAWAETTRITRVSLSTEGAALTFDAQSRWPDITSPGWDGPLQYTLWFAQQIDGRWYATGVIEFWRGLVAYGGDVTAPNQFGANWVYFASPLRQPAIGETIGFFVTAGDQRRKDVHAVAERSNLVTFPWNGRADVFTFGDAPTPVPAPAPGPSPTPTPGDTGELAALRAEVAQLTQAAHDAEATIADLRRQLDPATAMPNYDQTLAMIQRADAAFQAAQKAKKKTLLYPAACAHLTWRYLREGYTIEQLLADAAERGR